MVLRALLFARSTAIVPRTNARRLLCHQGLKCCPELPEHFAPIGASFSNRVKLLLHSGSEAEVNEGGEVRRQKIADRLTESRRAQSVLAITVNVLALLDALNDRRIC